MKKGKAEWEDLRVDGEKRREMFSQNFPLINYRRIVHCLSDAGDSSSKYINRKCTAVSMVTAATVAVGGAAGGCSNLITSFGSGKDPDKYL